MKGYYLRGKERKAAKDRVLKNMTKEKLEELKEMFIDNIEYCKQTKCSNNLNYWRYELKFINECLQEK